MAAKWYYRFKVNVADAEHTITITDSDFALLELDTDTSIQRLQESEGDSLKTMLRLAWYSLLRMKVEGIPTDYREFLLLGVSVDQESLETQEGKVSAPDQPTGASLNSL